MSNDTQKTLDGQTAKLISVISENLPHISKARMQTWINTKNRAGLQRALKSILTLDPQEFVLRERITVDDTWEKASLGVDWNKDTVSIDLKEVRGTGTDPICLLQIYGVALRLSIEYDQKGPPCTPFLRPWLCVMVEGVDGETTWAEFRSMEYWKGYHDPIVLNVNKIHHPIITRSQLADLESEYADKALTFLRTRYNFAISYDENPHGWTLFLHWLKDGRSENSFRFMLTRKPFADAFRNEGSEVPDCFK